MKPRLRLKADVWSCVAYRIDNGSIRAFPVIGYGYTPAEAYEDWKQQWRLE